MAHFAELDENNIVLRVIVVNNEDTLDDMGMESEQKGIEFCVGLLGGRWVQASYNRRIRKNYPAQGFTYDPQRDAFIPPQPGPEWVLDESTCLWVQP